MNEKSCFKCGITTNLINHHISYNPPKTVMCCKSCHRIIHNKIRKEGKCLLSSSELKEISTRLSLLRPESKIKQKEYRERKKRENDIDLDINELRIQINKLLK